MGTPWSNGGRSGIGNKVISGLAFASLLDRSGRDDQGDARENFKEPVNCTDPSDNTAGWLPGTLFSCGMFNYSVDDGGVRSGLSDFVSHLIQRGSAGGANNFQEYRSFSPVAEVVNFLQGRNAELFKAASQQIADLEASHRSEVTILNGKHEQQVTDSEARAQGQIRELSRNLKKVSKELSDALAQVSCITSSLKYAHSELLDRNKAVQTMQTQLDEEAKQKQDLSKRRDIIQKDIEANLRHVQEAGHVKEQEVHDRLNAIIKEKVKAVQDMEVVTRQLTYRCWNLQAHLADVEVYSRTTPGGSHSDHDHHANVRMLKDACTAADEAIDVLVPYLHDLSLASLRILSPDLYLAMANFFIPGQEKHVWGHWICMKIFVAFENVFFGVDDGVGRFTSPLDSKSHASYCFHSFHRKKGLSGKELFEKCHLFRAFCNKKYKDLFPSWLLEQALLPKSPQENVVFDDNLKSFNGDGGLWNRFIEFAKAFWMLHELVFSFDPPASILRVGQGEPYNGQYHENLNNDEWSPAMVQLVLRPAFRLKNTIIRSRVLDFDLTDDDI